MRVLVWAQKVTLTCVSCVSCVLGGLRSPRALAQGEQPKPTPKRLLSSVGAKGFLPLKAEGRCCIMVRGAALECQDDLKELACALHMHELHPWQGIIRESSFAYERANVMVAWAAHMCTHEDAWRLLGRIDVMLREDPAWAAQPCPACGMPQSLHTTYQAYLNRYAGSMEAFHGPHLDVDSEPDGTTSVFVALPHSRLQGGGACRVQHEVGELRWRVKGDGRVPRDWSRVSIDVGLYSPFDACWVDGRVRYHGVSKITAGTRYVFVIGRRCPVPERVA